MTLNQPIKKNIFLFFLFFFFKDVKSFQSVNRSGHCFPIPMKKKIKWH